MPWQRTLVDEDGEKIIEYGNYWYEDIYQWFMMLFIIGWVWLGLLVIAPWVWLYMKLTGHSCCVYRMTEEQINARNEQAALWNDRMENFGGSVLHSTRDRGVDLKKPDVFTPPPGM